jgi:hypothetical protein
MPSAIPTKQILDRRLPAFIGGDAAPQDPAHEGFLLVLTPIDIEDSDELPAQLVVRLKFRILKSDKSAHQIRPTCLAIAPFGQEATGGRRLNALERSVV